MKNRIPLLLILTLLFPLVAFSSPASADEAESEVLVVVKVDEVLAFSGPKNNWVSVSLNQNERVIDHESEGNVAVAYTNKRLLGFSVFTNKWAEKSLNFNESVKELQVDGNVATAVTDNRVFGFNGHTGTWLEAK